VLIEDWILRIYIFRDALNLLEAVVGKVVNENSSFLLANQILTKLFLVLKLLILPVLVSL
jgi:hypothetical protein